MDKFKIAIIVVFVLAIVLSNVFSMNYEKASKQNKPIVILFKTQTCSSCRRFEPTFDKITSKHKEKFNIVKEDCSFKVSEITKKLKIHVVPAVYIIEPQKSTAAKITNECLFNEECLEQTLNEYKS